MKTCFFAMKFIPSISILLLLFSSCPSTDNQDVSFNDEILPLFKAQCVRCHFDNASPGNLDLSTYESLMSGNSNHPDNLVVPGYPFQSLIYDAVASDEQAILSARMPQGGPYLRDVENQLIEDWIFQGAKDN